MPIIYINPNYIRFSNELQDINKTREELYDEIKSKEDHIDGVAWYEYEKDMVRYYYQHSDENEIIFITGFKMRPAYLKKKDGNWWAGLVLTPAYGREAQNEIKTPGALALVGCLPFNVKIPTSKWNVSEEVRLIKSKGMVEGELFTDRCVVHSPEDVSEALGK